MNKLAVAALTLLLFTTASTQEIKENPHTFNIGIEASSYSYKEPNIKKPVRWDGYMSGVNMDYTYRKEGASPLFLGAEFRYLAGKVDYEGWYGATQKIKTKDIKDYFVEGQIKSGIVLKITDNFDLRPYAGLGIRYLVDKFDKGLGGYRRSQNYFYAPLGVQSRLHLPRNWTLLFNGEADWLISGRQHSRFSDVMGALNTLSFEQDEGYGVRFSIKVQKEYQKFGFYAEPFFRYWHIQNSTPDVAHIRGSYVGTFREPLNETIEWGLKTGFTF